MGKNNIGKSIKNRKGHVITLTLPVVHLEQKPS
ncbi:hypothetical protein EZS27_026384 [termite gut metagenome]|uniref:Uncharacterized protein n=1 Tax=termite gut metagenome TaxID=433724 RepID=A0A5J4QT14_9ZZZZ